MPAGRTVQSRPVRSHQEPSDDRPELCSDRRCNCAGEQLDFGFRTSEFADGLPIMITVNPLAFTPSEVSHAYHYPKPRRPGPHRVLLWW
jgi:hypothetical protein